MGGCTTTAIVYPMSFSILAVDSNIDLLCACVFVCVCVCVDSYVSPSDVVSLSSTQIPGAAHLDKGCVCGLVCVGLCVYVFVCSPDYVPPVMQQ